MSSRIVWEGLAELRRTLIPVDSIRPHPRNPRRGDVVAIAASLARFGQMRPVLVRKETMEIVAGNHTFQAAVEKLGWNRIAATVAPMTETEAEAYLLADNRLGDLGRYDSAALAKLLGTRAEEPEGLVGLGYTAVDVDALLAELQADPPAVPQPRMPQAEGQRETVLLMDADTHQRFHERVRILGREWGIEGVSEVVYRAVTEAAKNP